MDSTADRMAKLRELSRHAFSKDFTQVAQRIAQELAPPEAPQPAPARRLSGAPRRPATPPTRR